MRMRQLIGNALRGFAQTVLDLDDTKVSQDQLVALQDLLSHQSFNQAPADLRGLIESLQIKHQVDSISISQTNGSLLASSQVNGASEGITASALFNYVQSEIPKSEVVLIKAQNSWNMLFKYNSKIFVVRAPMHLTTVELKAISNEVEAFLAKKKESEVTKL